MKEQFDSCSYNELTSCVKSRIKWIRENKRFLYEEKASSNYPNIKVQCVFKTFELEEEIRRLLEMRRILKSSGRKNWDSNYFGDV